MQSWYKGPTFSYHQDRNLSHKFAPFPPCDLECVYKANLNNRSCLKSCEGISADAIKSDAIIEVDEMKRCRENKKITTVSVSMSLASDVRMS